ncbi:DUF1186 domain-containing protein [Phragmitibacter flavus]|uniref:DUF1186 domain-containing protein n=1 Tax=Phragmitibacter flavus TaxID=2576071 RepID=UPI0023F3DA77|nr:DUF1186 domain-containing protein [Phragmitibacter flavus]
MTDEEILHAFRTAKEHEPPLEAIIAAREQRETITPHLLGLLRRWDTDAAVMMEEGDWICPGIAILLLGEFREAQAHELIVSICRKDEVVLDFLFADDVFDNARPMAATFSGDLEPLKLLVKDREADQFARAVALSAMTALLQQGHLSKESVEQFFADLFHGGLEREENHVWNELTNLCGDLCMTRLLPEVRKAFAEGLCDETYAGLSNIEIAMEGRDPWMGYRREQRFAEIDVLEELKGWPYFQPKREIGKDSAGNDFGLFDEETVLPPSYAPSAFESVTQPIRNEAPKIGRNDPCPCGSGKKYKKCCGMPF